MRQLLLAFDNFLTLLLKLEGLTGRPIKLTRAVHESYTRCLFRDGVDPKLRIATMPMVFRGLTLLPHKA